MTLSENDELEGESGIIAPEWQEAGAFLGQGFCLILRLEPTFTSGVPASYQPGTMQNLQANSQPAGISPFLVPPSLQDWNLSDTGDSRAPGLLITSRS